MRYFVGDDIVDDPLGSEDQPPAEGQIAARRAAAPAAFGIAHADFCHLVADARGERSRAPRQFVKGERRKMVLDPARNMPRIAAHADFAVPNHYRGRRAVERSTNPVRHVHHRHDRPFDERHRAGQGPEAGGDPSPFVFEKTQTKFGRHIARQHQFDPAFGGVDPQSDASRPRADPDRHRGAKVERRRLPADLGQCRFAARPVRAGRDAAKARHFAAFAREFADPCAEPSQKLSAAVLIPQARWR